jgi:predicted CopG family antitoxin
MERIDLESDVMETLMKHARPGESAGSVLTRLVEHKEREILREGVAHPYFVKTEGGTNDEQA